MGTDTTSDAALIDQLRRAVYMHFPERDIRAFEELVRRYERRRSEAEGKDQGVSEG